MKNSKDLEKEFLDDDIDIDFSNFEILKSKLNEQHNKNKKKNDDISPFKNDYNPKWKLEENQDVLNVNNEKNVVKQQQNKEKRFELDLKIKNQNKINSPISHESILKTKNIEQVINKKIDLNQNTNEYLQKNNLSLEKIRRIIESTLYVMGNDGMAIRDLQHLLDLPSHTLTDILISMQKEKENDVNSGLCIKQFGSRYKILTKEETYDDICTILNQQEKKPLNKTKLEILAIIAYNQPCTRKAIEHIRNKDCSNILLSLLELGLIDKSIATHLPGRPRLYTVTYKFFDLFGIKSLKELPKIDNLNNEEIVKLLEENQEDYDYNSDEEI